MMRKAISFGHSQATGFDDIDALRAFPLTGRFVYREIKNTQAHQQVLSRWPLLRELDGSVKRVHCIVFRSFKEGEAK